MTPLEVQSARADDRLWSLTAALCDGSISAEDLESLEAALRDDEESRLFFAAYMDLHGRLLWRFRSGEQDSGFGVGDLGFGVGDSGFGIRGMQIPNPKSQIPNHQILSPLTIGGPVFSYIAATLILGVMLLGAWAYKITHDYSPSRAINSSYAKNSRGLTAPGEPAQRPELVFVARVTGMKDCRWADPHTETYAGAFVPLGRKYALSSGLMEITYLSGAKVILEGPCSYEVESSAGGFLELGKLTAKVESENQSPKPQDLSPKTQISKSPNLQIPNPQPPTPNPLFSVRTPTAIVTDLGTEFGVEVSENGDTTSHVFQGKVVVRAEGSGVKDQGSGKRPATAVAGVKSNHEIQLNAGESARVEKGVGKVAKVDRASLRADSFVRQMPRRVPIKLFNTGVGLKEGDPDPHWQIVACSGDPSFKPQQATVTVTATQYRPNDSTRSQWISTAGDLPGLLDEAIYTFRTTFALEDIVLESAVLHGGFLADNDVVAIRINGRAVSLPESPPESPFLHFQPFRIEKGFVNGVNVLEIDVRNGPPPVSTVPDNPMAIRVELRIAAIRKSHTLLNRAGGASPDIGKEGRHMNGN